jgi:hypothetical protein
MGRPLIIDGRNLLDPDKARAEGFDYEGMGRPWTPPSPSPDRRNHPPPPREMITEP